MTTAPCSIMRIRYCLMINTHHILETVTTELPSRKCLLKPKARVREELTLPKVEAVSYKIFLMADSQHFIQVQS